MRFNSRHANIDPTYFYSKIRHPVRRWSNIYNLSGCRCGAWT